MSTSAITNPAVGAKIILDFMNLTVSLEFSFAYGTRRFDVPATSTGSGGQPTGIEHGIVFIIFTSSAG
jgi:hypothetical protein